ncbi:hypothetical protein SBADM41S_03790 [Streptomyces badius]
MFSTQPAIARPACLTCPVTAILPNCHIIPAAAINRPSHVSMPARVAFCPPHSPVASRSTDGPTSATVNTFLTIHFTTSSDDTMASPRTLSQTTSRSSLTSFLTASPTVSHSSSEPRPAISPAAGPMIAPMAAPALAWHMSLIGPVGGRRLRRGHCQAEQGDQGKEEGGQAAPHDASLMAVHPDRLNSASPGATISGFVWLWASCKARWVAALVIFQSPSRHCTPITVRV